MILYPTFTHAADRIRDDFCGPISYEVPATKWQGVDVSAKPEMRMRELLFYSFEVALNGIEDPEHWERDTGCNMPFARVHFLERVGGEPTNPGEAWKIWPWGHNAAKFLEVDGKYFSHTYQERLWPKRANRADWVHAPDIPIESLPPRHGIRYELADLSDLVEHLARDPPSRQAYVPIWFPEDGTCPGRKPCTLGYHFILRGNHLHIRYDIRSCDFIRHWADDCYLAVRLLLWILDRLRERDSAWKAVKPGLYVMHITSLHMFVNDYLRLKEEEDRKNTRARVLGFYDLNNSLPTEKLP